MRWVPLLALASACGEASDKAAPLANGANVLLVTIDTLRADKLGCYGGDPRVSPTLDALAGQGVLFESAYTPVPHTLPAHTTLMTGDNPYVHGIRANSIFRVPEAAATLAEHLRAAGYHTAAFPSADVLNATQGLDQGFDVYEADLGAGVGRPLPQRPAEDTTRRVLSWLETTGEQPFFAWVHYFDPHMPYETPADLIGRFESAYEAEIHHVDRHVARLLEALRSRNDLSNTLVCVTSDHGESLGEHGENSHGYFLYEATMRVPLLFVHPVLEPRRVPGTVSLQDIAPTLVEMVAAPSFPCAGRSLRPELAGQLRAPEDAYLETYVPYLSFGWSPMEGIVRDGWKYIEAPAPELFHLAADPEERNNRFKADQEQAARMREALSVLRASRGDRLDVEVMEANAQTAQALEVSVGTVEREWRFIKAWLRTELDGAG